MKCDEIRERISCMLDNELNAEDSAMVADHLARCPECMRVFEAFTAISVSLEAPEDVPEGFTEAVMYRVNKTAQQRKPQKTPRLRILRTVATAACLALVLLAGTQIANSPLYVGGGGIDVADFTRVGNDQALTAVTPAPTPTPFTGAESTDNSMAALSTDEEAFATTEAAVANPEVSAEPAVMPTPAITPTPIPTVTPTPVPSPVLLLKSDLLVVLEAAEAGRFSAEPTISLTVTDSSGRENSLQLWIDGTRIYCENSTAGTAYYTIGTAEELDALLGLTMAAPVPGPTASPTPAE